MGRRFQDLDSGKSLLRRRFWDVIFRTSIGAFSAVAPGGGAMKANGAVKP